MYRFLWIFFIYAFLGWCTEVSYAALKTGTFVNRGFLNGPLCPVYGFGVVIVLGCLTPLKENFFVLFLGSVVLTSILEGLTGLFLELIFHQRWWDYSDEPFNVHGYICLRFSIAWGLACVFVVDIIHPAIQLFIELMPHLAGVILLAVLGAAMGVDLIATVHTITRMNRRLSRIDELAAEIKAASNEFGEGLAARVLEAAERGADWRQAMEEWKEEHQAEFEERRAAAIDRYREREAALHAQLRELHERLQERPFGQRRLMRAFPGLRSTDHHQALERLRRALERVENKSNNR